MQIITLSGLDGSGKSTQIVQLQKHFESLGKKVCYFHAVQFSFASLITGKSRKKPGASKAVTKANCFQILIRKLFLLIDVWRFKRFLKKLEKEKYDILVSDRYFYDSIINILFLIECNGVSCTPSVLHDKFLLFVQKHIIKPDTALFLDVSPAEILRRERDIEQGETYLKGKNQIYTQNLNQFHIDSINSEKGKEEVFKEVLKKI